MIKNKFFTMMMLIAATTSNGAVNEYSKNGNFRIVQANEYIQGIEARAYSDLLRVVDEINRQNGINSNYIKKANSKESRIRDEVDIIPVATYTDDYDNFKSELERLVDAKRGQSYHGAENLIKNKEKAFNEKEFDDLSYKRTGTQKRFYFGNGNVAKDIIFNTKHDFEKKLKDIKDTENEKYILEGTYKSIDTKNLNQLDISMDDYYSKIERKSRADVAEYLKNKILEKNSQLGVYRKGEELYTKDSNGKEWKVLWNLEPVSIFQTAYVDENKRFKDTIFTQIYIYDSSMKENDSAGRSIYKKDGSIILEDKYIYNNDLLLKQGSTWAATYKNLDEVIARAREKAESGIKNGDNAIENYFIDKKNLNEAEFTKKWITPFEKDGDFYKDLNVMKSEINATNSKLEIIKKEYEKAKEKVSEIQNSGKIPNDFNIWSWKYETEQEKEKYLSTKSEEEKKIILEYINYTDIQSSKWSQQIKLEEQIQTEIPKKYGFYNGWGATTENKKWMDRVIWDNNVVKDLLGKNIEFRGKGRIEGTVDLGQGDNQITVTEQFTGKYGTNIILGPYSKLKNIKVVNVAGGSTSGVSISGRTSLTMDIDPNIKNSDGELTQHALKDSDSNIIFRKSGSDNSDSRNDFSIELMVSKIGEDSNINMGRKINYEITDVKTGEKLEMKIPFISDSIAHNLIDNKEIAKDGNSILNVKVKNEIKRLTEDENRVYKSIKDAGKVAVLHPTLTSSNKKTTFSVLDDTREESKKLALALYLKTKTADEILKDLSQFNLRDTNKNQVLDAIQKIKDGNVVKQNIKKEETLNEKIESILKLEKNDKYNDLKLNKVLAALKEFDITELRNNRENEDVRNKSTEKIKSILEELNVSDLEELKNEYTNLNLGDLYTSLISAKDKASKVVDKWDFSFLLSGMEGLIASLEKQVSYNSNDLKKELKKINNELSDELEKYAHDTKQEYEFLKGKLFYTVREEEVLFELKNILAQIKDRNIYSKLNKISKNEISNYTNIPFDINHHLSEKEHYSRGGFISSRTVQQNFKGNIYTAYGIFEKNNEKNSKLGFIIGGANSTHNEVYERTLNTVATESKIKGVSAYLGGYHNKELLPNLNWINGLGLQYGRYTIDRDMRNTYQGLKSKGKTDINAANTYTGLVANFPVHEDVSVQVKGLLSYSFIKQNKVNESGDLPLAINSNIYHYLDGEMGISFTKLLYGDDMKSSISAGIYGIAGLTGYKNNDMNAKINNSASEFKIKGDKVKKDAVKVFIDYNVQTDEGYNYGLEGTYTSNSKENNVKIGIKAGYVF